MKILVIIFSFLELVGLWVLVKGTSESATIIGYFLWLTSILLREIFLCEILDKIKERKN